MEPEFNDLASHVPGLAIHCARVHQESTTVKGLLDMEPLVVNTAAPDLADASVGVIVYGCTSGSFSGGPGWDQEIIKRIQEKTGIPTTTASTAVMAALKALNARKVALGTPYSDEVTRLGQAFLESKGFEVVNTIGLDNVIEIGDAPFSLAYQLSRKLDSPEVDCLVISCTKFPTLEIISFLETDLGKPVISSNVASFWHALQILGIKSRFSGYGCLIEGESAADTTPVT
jgi:maleate cis-trans isomerase